MKLKTFYKFFAILSLFVIFISGCSEKKAVFKIRNEVAFLEINSDLTSLYEYNIHFRNGVELALNEINRLGGINGKKVVIYHCNDFLNYLEAKKSIIAYKDTNILAAFGAYFSSAAEGISSGSDYTKIPFLSSSYSGKMIYELPNDYTYNLRPGLYSVLKALALEANELDNLNRWLIISYSNDEGQKASKYFEKQIMLLYNNKQLKSSDNKDNTKNLAFKFNHIYISPFKANEFLFNSNFLSILNEVKAVLILTNGKDLQYLLEKNQLKKVLASKIVFVPFAGEPEWLSYFSSEITPENWIVTGYPWYALSDKLHKDFYNKYYNIYKLQPRYASILGYISVYVLVNCAKQINLDNPDIYALREEFNKMLSSAILKESPLGSVYLRSDHFSNLGIFTGNLNIFTQNIISEKGTKMLLKDIRMENIKYYDNSKINFTENYGNKIRDQYRKINENITQQINKNVNDKFRLNND